jgi:hypothetical protein
VLAQQAAKKHTFVHRLRRGTLDRRSRVAPGAGQRDVRTRGWFPAIKTLDQYDFSFAAGTPRSQIRELAPGIDYYEIVWPPPASSRHQIPLHRWLGRLAERFGRS